MMQTSRRNVLGAALAAPFIAAPSIAAAQPNRTAWREAVSAFRTADEACSSAFDAFEDANLAFNSAVRALPPEHNGRPLPLLPGETGDEMVVRYNQSVVDAKAARKREIEELRQHHRCDELEAGWRAASDRYALARDALFATPSPDMEALAEKLEITIDRDLLDEAGAAILADVRRLARAGA